MNGRNRRSVLLARSAPTTLDQDLEHISADLDLPRAAN